MTAMLRFLTTTQAGALSGASSFTIRHEIAEGRLPALQIRRNWRIPVDGLEKWMQSRCRGMRVEIDRRTGDVTFHPEPEAVAIA
jgi:excisionase family DNA binding protein